MDRNDSIVSIIIVAYKHPELLQKCLLSVFKQDTSFSFEVIVVDNSPTDKLEGLVSDFALVKYRWSPENLGYGGGNNLGAQAAVGKYLFFLNPDTELYSGVIQRLHDFLESNKQAAIAAPTLVDQQGDRFPEQGADMLTPYSAVATGSIFHRFWPQNPWARNYWLSFQDAEQDRKLFVVPGTALMIRKKVFEQVGWFDEQFFLYFEEHDLCRRVKMAGWDIWQLAAPKVKHQWEGTTKEINTNPIFRQSRLIYFNKYYGLVMALLTESVLRVSKIFLLILFLLAVIMVLIIVL